MYLFNLLKNIRRHWSNYLPLIFTCCQRCQDIALGLNFLLFFSFGDITKIKGACWDAKESKVEVYIAESENYASRFGIA